MYSYLSTNGRENDNNGNDWAIAKSDVYKSLVEEWLYSRRVDSSAIAALTPNLQSKGLVPVRGSCFAADGLAWPRLDGLGALFKAEAKDLAWG